MDHMQAEEISCNVVQVVVLINRFAVGLFSCFNSIYMQEIDCGQHGTVWHSVCV